MRAEMWESKLAAYLEDVQPFQWGVRDCALWASGWVLVCTGEDYLSSWKGRYKTAKGAKIIMTRRGFADVAAIASSHLTEKPVGMAQRGDLILHPVQGSLGICNGLKSHFLTESGVTVVPTLSCPHAWAV